jgi:predicted nucleic acid-binding protein
MKVLVDTNVILDVLLHRDPFFDHSRTILAVIEQKEVSGYISASAFTDIFYLINKKIKGINTAGQALHPPPTAASAASRGVLNPSVPHSLNHARASTVAISLRSSIKNTEKVYKAADELTAIFTIAPVFEHTIKNALALHWKDFEDAVQYITAQENNADYIITRNANDYKTPSLPCMSPTDFLAFLKTSDLAQEDKR